MSQKRGLTEKGLKDFVALRNASSLNTNMQFHIDADACGFDMSDLGAVTSLLEGVFQWNTPYGLLTEANGRLELRKNKSVSPEQESAEWKLLKELNRLIQAEPTFVYKIQEYFNPEKSVDDILAEMQEAFGD